MNNKNTGSPLFTVLVAVILLGLLSLIPWGNLTDNYFKDFNLLGDIFPGSIKITAEEMLDPNLEEAHKSLAKEEQKQREQRAELEKRAKEGDESATKLLQRSSLADEVETPKSRVNNIVGGTVIIEDYTVAGNGPAKLRNALSNNSGPARIAVIGDSYIEGDILTSDIRQQLQDSYGGKGVGYVPLSSPLVGFRQTVKQTCDGWTIHEIRDKGINDSMKSLSGQYFTSSQGATSSFKGTLTYPHLNEWDKTTVLAIAPRGGVITVGSNSYTLSPSSEVQGIVSEGTVSSVNITATPGIDVLGAYLDGKTGVLVDNMSLRGNSGITHRNISVELADGMSKFIDYDMIVVEYGINALSSQQKDYSGYKKLMKKTIGRLREAYPNADILLLGIGDRGQKVGSEVKSVPTSENMVQAQRDAAREMGVLFWDMRAAMGGENAVLDWRDKGLINPDYIHLNQKGGKALGTLFVKALKQALN